MQQSVTTMKLLQYLLAILNRLDKETTPSSCAIEIGILYFPNVSAYVGLAYTLLLCYNLLPIHI